MIGLLHFLEVNITIMAVEIFKFQMALCMSSFWAWLETELQNTNHIDSYFCQKFANMRQVTSS